MGVVLLTTTAATPATATCASYRAADVVRSRWGWNGTNLHCCRCLSSTSSPLNFNFIQRSRRRRRVSSPTVASMREIGKRAAKWETVIPEPDYRIPAALLGLAGISLYEDNLLAAAPIGLLGLLLLFQTTRVRFVFDEEALNTCTVVLGELNISFYSYTYQEVKVGEQLQDSGENIFVGGKNRWKYSTFVNWELWWPNFPILVYFKETQTRPEGQVHFFPVIFNGKQLYDVMVERAGLSKTSGPRGS